MSHIGHWRHSHRANEPDDVLEKECKRNMFIEKKGNLKCKAEEFGEAAMENCKCDIEEMGTRSTRTCHTSTQAEEIDQTHF